ncbi:hypothetical protein B566_EDAN012657 [Ephemera danica]|nr:hypothetical protein B566_EDAN012657 [Ephemera danica]
MLLLLSDQYYTPLYNSRLQNHPPTQTSLQIIHENISPKVVQTEKWLNLTLHCNANEVPGATVFHPKSRFQRRTGKNMLCLARMPHFNPDITLENNNKYVIEETELNEDATLMQLTVRNIEPGDYLVYGCESDNRYGGIKIERRLSNHSIEHLL